MSLNNSNWSFIRRFESNLTEKSFESSVCQYLSEAGIHENIDSILNEFKTKESTLTGMARGDNQASIVRFMEERKIGTPFQRDEVAFLMAQQYKETQTQTQTQAEGKSM